MTLTNAKKNNDTAGKSRHNLIYGSVVDIRRGSTHTHDRVIKTYFFTSLFQGPYQLKESKELYCTKLERRRKWKMCRVEVRMLILVLLAPVVFSQDTEVCPNIQSCLTTLTTAFNTFCNPVPCSCPVDWESMTMTSLGTINMQSTTTQSFVIPTTVPSTAREVLVYTYVNKGRSQEYFSNMKIYTESSPTRRFEKYLAIKTYNQNAYSTVSENMFFPMPSNRRIYVRLSRTHPGHVSGHINIIGYR